MKAKSLFEILREAGKEEIVNNQKTDRILGNFANSSEWLVLKTQVIEPKIKALLVQADDLAKAMEGEISVEQLGIKTLVARIAAGHLQDIIDRVEITGEWLEKEKAKEGGGKK